MEKIKKNWLKLILWAGAYVNLIIFALCGGYVYIKTEDEDIKKEIKKIFLISLLFVGLEMFLSLISSILGMAKSADYGFYNVLSGLVTIGKIITYVVFGVLAFFDIKLCKKEEVKESTTEEDKKEETTTQDEQNKD